MFYWCIVVTTSLAVATAITVPLAAGQYWLALGAAFIQLLVVELMRNALLLR